MLAATVAGNRHRERFSWIADGRGRTTTLEALYFRAMLLDRFTSGSLTAPQMAIVDAWLWEWTPALKGEFAYPGGDVLRVDLDSAAGLRDGKREGEGPTSTWLSTPLGERRNHRESIAAPCAAHAGFRDPHRVHICVSTTSHTFRAPASDARSARRARPRAEPARGVGRDAGDPHARRGRGHRDRPLPRPEPFRPGHHRAGEAALRRREPALSLARGHERHGHWIRSARERRRGHRGGRCAGLAQRRR